MADPPVPRHFRKMMRVSRLLLLVSFAVGTLGEDYNFYNYNNNYNNYNQNPNNYYSDSSNQYSNQYSSQYSSSSSSSSSSSGQDISVSLSVCEDSVVEMTSLTASCDSPYTFYYGNGANRNSATCDYGDKVSLSGTFRVVDNLQDGDDIYVTAAVYDDASNLLATIAPTDLCDTYVGSDCTVKGSYSFTERLKLGQPNCYDDYATCAESTKFRPVIQMAFSTKPDSGYNLGAVNTLCPQWDQNNPSYVDWSGEEPQRSPTQVFLSDNGMLIATCIAVFAFAMFIWVKAREGRTDMGFSASTSLEVGIMELS